MEPSRGISSGSQTKKVKEASGSDGDTNNQREMNRRGG